MLSASKSHIATGMATWSWRWSCKLTGASSHHSKWSSQGLGAYAIMLVVAPLMLSLAHRVAVDTLVLLPYCAGTASDWTRLLLTRFGLRSSRACCLARQAYSKVCRDGTFTSLMHACMFTTLPAARAASISLVSRDAPDASLRMHACTPSLDMPWAVTACAGAW
jgi:hypothetical protein